ncbi:guanylate kinase [Thiotrichales bacterium 19S3-7]|nr:guanylate kinase [Thiotrichales bacterium 19S3-7]MCF6800977.1 guanylate kinase [Thiotrichales bacterium 19S3-11]
MNTREGLIFVISAPSGAGKTSLVKSLLEDIADIDVCISHTTRASREGEKQNEAYYFVKQDEFEFLVNEDAFVEHAKVFDHYYGTSKAEISRVTSSGYDVILEIDWQGAKQILKQYPKQAVSIFVLPPSLETLKERLEKRAKDSAEVIQKRLEKAKWEIKEFHHYDYLLINDDFNQTLMDLISIIKGERIRHQHDKIAAFIQEQLL